VQARKAGGVAKAGSSAGTGGGGRCAKSGARARRCCPGALYGRQVVQAVGVGRGGCRKVEQQWRTHRK